MAAYVIVSRLLAVYTPFDGRSLLPYTRAVFRSLAAFAALSLITLQAQSLAFHVHAVGDTYDDDQHNHGPAIHAHGGADFDEVLHVEAQDSQARGAVITIAVPAAIATIAIVVHIDFAETSTAPTLQLIGDARAIEVRSHGPPPAGHSFLRGPPNSILL